ncbi:MAG: type I methionyl aminopeptidase [Planctomycetaceae bacterium]|nr:type I methionyl aminopeptidase [Planctomycetaceae bacterium]
MWNRVIRGLTRGKRPPIYNERQRAQLREAGEFNARLIDYLRPYVQPGVATRELDRLAEEFTRDHGHRPACLGYKGYPKHICTSVNQVVCHGIPGDYVLRDGDIVNVDATTIVNGWYGDSSETFLIGDVSSDVRRLVQATFDAMWRGIRVIKPMSSVIEIGYAISRLAHDRGLSVVEEYQGHGLGRRFHQPPGVPHYPLPQASRDVLVPGVCFTIEPMLNLGAKQTSPPALDGWTVTTADGSFSAQFEHTILMTEHGPEVLTLTQHGPQEGHQF